jgi:hypothetical protein
MKTRRRSKAKRAVKPWIVAEIFTRCDARRMNVRQARVTIDTTSIVPSVPYVIRVDDEYFVCTDTNPLQYASATFGTATLIPGL